MSDQAAAPNPDDIPEEPVIIDAEDDDDVAAQAAFDAGYDGDDTVEVPDDTPDPDAALEESLGGEPAAPPVEEPPEEPEPLVAEPDPLADRVRSLEGKIGSLTDNLTKALAGNVALGGGGGEAPTSEQVAEATQSTEKFDALAEEFPEWADAMKEQIGIVESSVMGKIPTPEAIDEAIGEAATRARQFAYVDIKHENWEETIQSTEFGQWLDQQDYATQALADSELGRDASKLLDKFKSFKQDSDPGSGPPHSETGQQRQQRLEGAVDPTRPGGTNPDRQAPDDDAEEAFAAGFRGE
jgi:hypothetical protein